MIGHLFVLCKDLKPQNNRRYLVKNDSILINDINRLDIY